MHARGVGVEHAIGQHIRHSVEPDGLTLDEPGCDVGARAQHLALLHVRRNDDIDALAGRCTLGPQHDLDVERRIEPLPHVGGELLGGHGDGE